MWNTKKNDVVFIYKENVNANEKERCNKYGMKVEMGDTKERKEQAFKKKLAIPNELSNFYFIHTQHEVNNPYTHNAQHATLNEWSISTMEAGNADVHAYMPMPVS